MVIVVAIQDLPQPDALFGNRVVASRSQLLRDFMEFGTLPFRHRRPHQQELPAMCASAYVGEAQERERAGLPLSILQAILPSKWPESNDTGLFRVERQLELFHPRSHFIEESLCVLTVGESHDDIVRIADDDDFSCCLVLAPVVGPKVEHVVQIHVGQQGRDRCALGSALLRSFPLFAFENPGFEPLLDQAQDSGIGDAVLEESH